GSPAPGHAQSGPSTEVRAPTSARRCMSIRAGKEAAVSDQPPPRSPRAGGPRRPRGHRARAGGSPRPLPPDVRPGGPPPDAGPPRTRALPRTASPGPGDARPVGARASDDRDPRAGAPAHLAPGDPAAAQGPVHGEGGGPPHGTAPPRR